MGLFTTAVVVTFEDGREMPLVLDQRDMIAAADKGHMPPGMDGAKPSPIGFARYLRAAACAHLLRTGAIANPDLFDLEVVDVSPRAGDTDPDPTPPGTSGD